jgi:hypothetical protein
MQSGGTHRTHKGTGKAYRIVVGGELSQRYAMAFERMEMKTETGHTVLTGEGLDQPHLHGILTRINALGLELVSVQLWPGKSEEQAGAERG